MRFDPETMKVKLCKKCKGLGYGIDLRGSRFKCAECSGTGRVVEKTLKEEFTLDSLSGDLSFDEETMRVVICKECGGLGTINYLDGERKCENCHGTGRIIEEKITTEYQLHHVEGIMDSKEESTCQNSTN